MGRQVNFCMMPEDEKGFIEFAKSTNEVSFIYPDNKNKTLNLSTDLPSPGPYKLDYYIWNKKFKFKPEFTEIKKQYRKKFRYAFDPSKKPVIEFSRCHFIKKNELVAGRLWIETAYVKENKKGDLFWEQKSKDFIKFYDSLSRWIKSHYTNYGGVYISQRVIDWLGKGNKIVVFGVVCSLEKLKKGK